jgi:hypothetical protein
MQVLLLATRNRILWYDSYQEDGAPVRLRIHTTSIRPSRGPRHNCVNQNESVKHCERAYHEREYDARTSNGLTAWCPHTEAVDLGPYQHVGLGDLGNDLARQPMIGKSLY